MNTSHDSARIDEQPNRPLVQGVSAREAREITGHIWLSRTEAAIYLGISAKTLAQHRKDGPPYAKLFGVVRYRLSDIDSWSRQKITR